MRRKINLRNSRHIEKVVFPVLLDSIQSNNPYAFDLFIYAILRLYIKNHKYLHPLTLFTDSKLLFHSYTTRSSSTAQESTDAIHPLLEMEDKVKSMLDSIPEWLLYTYLDRFEANIEQVESEYGKCPPIELWKKFISLSPKKISYEEWKTFRTNLTELSKALMNPNSIGSGRWWPTKTEEDELSKFEKSALVYSLLHKIASKVVPYKTENIQEIEILSTNDIEESLVCVNKQRISKSKRAVRNPPFNEPRFEIFKQLKGRTYENAFDTYKNWLATKPPYPERMILGFVLCIYTGEEEDRWNRLKSGEIMQ